MKSRQTCLSACCVVLLSSMGLSCGGRAADGPETASSPDRASLTTVAAEDRGEASMQEVRLRPEDVAAEHGLVGQPGYGRGVSVVDLDGDGWEDLFMADTDARTRGDDFGVSTMYRNRGGTFEPWDVGISDEDVFANTGATFGDMDGDGDPDMLLVNGNNTTRSTLALYENRLGESGEMVDVTDGSGVPVDTEAWWGATWVDIEVDGDLDLIVTGSRTVLLVNNGEGIFEDQTAERGLTAWTLDPIHKNPVVMDIDNDGYPDLASAGGSPAVIFRNDRTGTFTDVTATAIPADMPDHFWLAGFAAAAADFNQDGFEDLYMGRFWYRDYVLINQGDGTFEAHSQDIGLDMASYSEDVPPFGQPIPAGPSASPTTPTTWVWPSGYDTGELEAENTMGLTVGDVNGDGSPDVLIGTGDPSAANPDILLCGKAPGDGSVRFERCAADIVEAMGNTRGHGFGMGDLDRDGAMDLVANPGGWTEFDTERGVDTREHPKLFLGLQRSGTPPASVDLRIDGRPAFGAALTLTTDPPLHATVHGEQGFQSRSSTKVQLHIDEVTSVKVRWPGGRTTQHELSPGQAAVIEEPR